MTAARTAVNPAHILTEQHLHIVKDILTYHIRSNPSIPGMEPDDLYQEGCICLYRAALTYNSQKALFSTYAKKVVYRGLIDYCRKQQREYSHTAQVQVLEDGSLLLDHGPAYGLDDVQARCSTLEVLDLMERSAVRYQGITKLGIEALAMKIQGVGITEIASVYQVAPSHVGAWISRAIHKLRKDPAFLAALQ